MKKLNKKGFTLAELLIVVAIIAVLVAIAIPVFTSQLEKAREATDAANLRAAYAEAAVKVLESETDVESKPVEIKQTTAGWVSNVKDIAGVKVEDDAVLKVAVSGQKIVVTVKANGDAPTFALKTN